MPKLSAIVITYNEEKNIAACLESLKWADEIILIDSTSTDKTVEIARTFTDRVFVMENIPYGDKKNIGIDKATAEWIFWIDADERVTQELKDEILRTVEAPSFDAYQINRKSYFISKFIKHSGWYPDYTIRFFRKSSGIRFSSALVHESISYTGEKGKLKGELLHYTDMDFEHYLNKLDNYTNLSASELHEKGRKSGPLDIIFRPVFAFFKMYFLKLGLLDGYMGLVLCILSSVHVFMKYSKLYFINKDLSNG